MTVRAGTIDRFRPAVNRQCLIGQYEHTTYPRRSRTAMFRLPRRGASGSSCDFSGSPADGLSTGTAGFVHGSIQMLTAWRQAEYMTEEAALL